MGIMVKKKILVIDDEEDLLTFVKIRLVNNNYEVAIAHDGEEGLRMAETANPDLILLDVMLPKIEGFKVCDLLKSDPKTAGIPIIMLTAMDSKEAIEMAKKHKADGYLIKPFDSQFLLFNVKNLLSKKQVD